MYKYLILFVLIFCMISCNKKDNNTERITVASKMGNCIGVAPMKCLIIKKQNSDNWEFLYSGIEGFTHTEGYEYVLEIKKETVENPAADQSSVKYKLVKEISKIKKESENLPNIPSQNE